MNRTDAIDISEGIYLCYIKSQTLRLFSRNLISICVNSSSNLNCPILPHLVVHRCLIGCLVGFSAEPLESCERSTTHSRRAAALPAPSPRGPTAELSSMLLQRVCGPPEPAAACPRTNLSRALQPRAAASPPACYGSTPASTISGLQLARHSK